MLDGEEMRQEIEKMKESDALTEAIREFGKVRGRAIARPLSAHARCRRRLAAAAWLLLLLLSRRRVQAGCGGAAAAQHHAASHLCRHLSRPDPALLKFKI